MKIYKVKLDPSNPIEKLIKVPVGSDYGIQINWDYGKYPKFINTDIDTENGFLTNYAGKWEENKSFHEIEGQKIFTGLPILTNIGEIVTFYYGKDETYDANKLDNFGSIKVVGVDTDDYDVDIGGDATVEGLEYDTAGGGSGAGMYSTGLVVGYKTLDKNVIVDGKSVIVDTGLANVQVRNDNISINGVNNVTLNTTNPDDNATINLIANDIILKDSLSNTDNFVKFQNCTTDNKTYLVVNENGTEVLNKPISELGSGSGGNGSDYIVEWSDQYGWGCHFLTIGFKPDTNPNNMYNGDQMLQNIYIGSEYCTYIGTACLLAYNPDYNAWEYVQRTTQYLYLNSSSCLEIVGMNGCNGIYINCSDPGNNGWYTNGQYNIGALTINSQNSPVVIANYNQDYHDSSHEQGVHICTKNGDLKFCVDTDNGFGWTINGRRIKLEDFLNHFGEYVD